MVDDLQPNMIKECVQGVDKVRNPKGTLHDVLFRLSAQETRAG